MKVKSKKPKRHKKHKSVRSLQSRNKLINYNSKSQLLFFALIAINQIISFFMS